MATSIDQREIAHFSKDSGRWWDESGPFAPLHRLNPVRMGYIRGQIGRHYGLSGEDLRPFQRLRILDAGCGGGLVCEALVRLGADVTGIDADEQAIVVARDHAAGSGLSVDYRNVSVEELLTGAPPLPPPQAGGNAFDVVLALEIAEHVSDVDGFVDSCVNLCKPGGIVIFSTLNRTPQSFALGIVAAERILRWVPPGTHQWKKFLKPSELAQAVRKAGARQIDVKGLSYSAFRRDFELSDDVSVNYFLCAVKS